MDYDYIEAFLYGGPIVLGVLNQCKKLGLNPWLPIAGLVVGLLIEMKR